MKLFLSILLTLLPLPAQIVTVTDATPREVILRYVAPTPASCTIEVSESPSYTPPVNDVDTTLFAGSNSDFRNGAQGRERTFIIGAAGTGINYAPIALNGLRMSRAMQTNTDHYYRLTCGADTATGVIRTANIAPGDTRPKTEAPIDPASPGATAWPFIGYNGASAVIDPVTGVLVQNLFEYDLYKQDIIGPIPFNFAYDEAGTWTAKNSALDNNAVVASFTGAGNNPLKFATTWIQNNNGPLVGLTLYVKGYVDAGTTTAEACLMIDGATCYGPWVTLPALPVGAGAIAAVQVGDPNINTDSLPSTPPMMGAWTTAGQDVSNIRNWTGLADNVGAALTLRTGGGKGAFDPAWTTQTHLTYNAIEYTAASVTNPGEMAISSAPANLTSQTWLAHNFGFMIRKKSAGGTLNIDYVTFVPSFVWYQGQNQGQGGSKQCTTTRYHSGFRLSGTTNASPIVITTSSAHDYVTGDVVKVKFVTGNTAANGSTWTITVINSTSFSLTSSTGNGAYVNGGLVWKVSGPTGHYCVVSGSASGGYETYWINPDTTPATIHYLGQLYLSPTAFNTDGGTWTGGQQPIAEVDPDVPSVYMTVANSGVGNLWRGDYIGHAGVGMFQSLPRYQGSNPWSYGDVWKGTNLTPTTSLAAQWAAFAPSESGISLSVNRVIAPGILGFQQNIGAQNSRGRLGVYDANTSTVLGLMNTWGPSGARFCGLHTALPWEGSTSYQWVPYEDVIENYRMRITSGAISGTATDCATQFTALGVVNTLGVTGSNCTTITVDTATPYTPALTPAGPALGAVRLGDGFRFYNYAGGTAVGATDTEVMRLVGQSGLSFILQRNFSNTAYIEIYGVQAHASGGWLQEFCSVTPRWWDYTLAPNGETAADLYSQNISGIVADAPFANGSHILTRDNFSVNDAGLPFGVAGFVCSGAGAPYSTRNYPWPNHVNAPASAYGCNSGNPLFDGKNGAGEGNNLEKHPGPVQNFLNNPSWFDYRPLLTSNLDTQETVTKVGTYVYKVTGFNQFQSFDEKRNVLYAVSGHKTLRDVSAASFTLPDTAPYNYTYCLPHVNGECWAGSTGPSTTGEVYINAPFVSKIQLGSANAGSYKCQTKQDAQSGVPFMNDICVQIMPNQANYATQYSRQHDPGSSGNRLITSGMHTAKSSGQSESFPVLPNGDWGITQGNGRLFLTKIPPYPGVQRGINRSSWIPIPVKLTSVPAGTNNVVVEFGYNPNFWCSTRQEACIANAASVTSTIYNYATSDTYSGLACASGCTPVIPALSQRVMWYRVEYRNGSNAVIKTGETQVIATP